MCLKSKLYAESARATAARKKVRKELKIMALGLAIGLIIAVAYTIVFSRELTLLTFFLWTYLPFVVAAGIQYFKFIGKVVTRYFRTFGACVGIFFIIGLIFLLVILVFLLPAVGLFRIFARLIDNWKLNKIIKRDNKQIEYLEALAADMTFTEHGPTVPSGALGSNSDEEISFDVGGASSDNSSFQDNGEIIFRAEAR